MQNDKRRMLNKTPDGSILDVDGKVIYFSIERFVKDICVGDCCFICGADPSVVEFNNEHILPDWVLRNYDLYSKNITLPNLTGYRYDQYTVPCCKDCNSEMGNVFETPISSLVQQGFNETAEYLKNNGTLLFFSWLSLIFLKTHLKDKSLRLHRDFRKGDDQMSSFYEWEELHHIHCIARSFYTNPFIESETFGSFLMLPAMAQEIIETFDYADLYHSRSILLRLNDMCFIAVLNDSNGALSSFNHDLEKIDGALSPLQLREVFSHLSYINSILKTRPKFYSRVEEKKGYTISAHRPEIVELDGYNREDFGHILFACTHQMLRMMENEDVEEILSNVETGKWTFLFDRDGNFIKDSLILNKTTVD